jgi:hypothetical protein
MVGMYMKAAPSAVENKRIAVTSLIVPEDMFLRTSWELERREN